MHVIALNGSPRKNGNTATLLNKALEGAASQGADTEFIQMNTLKIRGCQGCYSCKKRGGKSYGKCALKDDLTPLYKKIEQADALFLGSPIYFHSVTSAMKMFIERLYPYFSYKDFKTTFPRKVNVGMIYTIGADDQDTEKLYRKYIKINQNVFSLLIGPTEVLVSTDTLNVSNYSELVADMLEPRIERKLKHNREIFPQDCQKAFEMGARFTRQSTPA
jgi:multimeric flavodoxin WrbA